MASAFPELGQADEQQPQSVPRQADSPAAQRANETQMPASGESTTQEAKSFTGNILKENNKLILKDTITKVSYNLDDPARARSFVGKRVKIVGKLDMDTNTIRVESIETAE